MNMSQSCTVEVLSAIILGHTDLVQICMYGNSHCGDEMVMRSYEFLKGGGGGYYIDNMAYSNW